MDPITVKNNTVIPKCKLNVSTLEAALVNGLLKKED
jgi:hypothetical protein